MGEKSNLVSSDVDQNIRDIFAMTFELYKIAESNNNLYKSADKDIPKKLIYLYYDEIKPDYNKVLYNFRKKYVVNESKVEKNDTKLEQSGIALVYDYIQNFKSNEDYFNIFVTGLELHKLLYKPLDDRNNGNRDELYREAFELQEEAKKEKDIKKYKLAKEKLSELSFAKPFGGVLRDTDVELKDTDVKVPSALEAKIFYNTFLNKEKVIEYNNMLSSVDIFKYIDYCVYITTTLIKYQPFQDGNKRTFRSLLNLMFKNRNLPPVYITKNERKRYKELLFNALENDDFDGLYHFYYYKICDSIYELDIKPYLELNASSNIKQSTKQFDEFKKLI